MNREDENQEYYDRQQLHREEIVPLLALAVFIAVSAVFVGWAIEASGIMEAFKGWMYG